MSKRQKPKCQNIYKFFSKQIPASSKKVQDDITTDSPSCSTAVTISQDPFTTEHKSETTASPSSLSKTATASMNIPSYADISSLSDSDIQNTDVKMKLWTGIWKDARNFPFPARFIR